jgi:hypothetical protein
MQFVFLSSAKYQKTINPGIFYKIPKAKYHAREVGKSLFATFLLF